MKKYTAEELEAVLDAHQAWLGDGEGNRAHLSHAVLREIVKIGRVWVHVRLDKSGRTVRALAEDLEVVCDEVAQEVDP